MLVVLIRFSSLKYSFEKIDETKKFRMFQMVGNIFILITLLF